MKFSKNEMSGKFISKSLSRYLVVQAIFNESFGFDKNRIRDDFVSEKDIKFLGYLSLPTATEYGTLF